MTPCPYCFAADEWKHTDSCPTVAIEERDALLEALAKPLRQYATRYVEGDDEIAGAARTALHKLAALRRREADKARRTARGDE